MHKIIIGSTAMRQFGCTTRKGDVDVLIRYGHGYLKEEGEDALCIPSDLFDVLEKHSYNGYLKPYALYALKLSHIEWDIKWFKHAKDILYFKKRGVKVCQEIIDAFKPYWVKLHGDKTRLSLKRTKQEFFDDAVIKEFEHDWLHEVVAINSIPVYSTVLKDGEEVLVDKAKFDNLPKDQQLRMFLEEIYVIALGRWLIPSKFKMHPRIGYLLALQKTVTNLTKGWASQFIIDNLDYYYEMSDLTFVYNFMKTQGNVYMDKVQNFGVFKAWQEELVVMLFRLGYTWDIYVFTTALLSKSGRYDQEADDVQSALEAQFGYEKLTIQHTSVYGESQLIFRFNGKVISAPVSYSPANDSSFDSSDEFITISKDFFEWVEVKPVEKTMVQYESVT